jgi:calcineurin-like phosphoesterase family protein
MSRKFYTSDLHFSHDNIRGYCNRPWSNVEEMNQDLINNWNNKVAKNDLIYIVGDFTLEHSQTRIKYFLDQLNGQKYLIMGNHDRKNPEGFHEVSYYKEVRDSFEEQTYKVVLFHYPIEGWYGSYGKDKVKTVTIHLHGHAHGLCRVIPGRYDIGVDQWNYEPVTLAEILNSERTRLLNDK